MARTLEIRTNRAPWWPEESRLADVCVQVLESRGLAGPPHTFVMRRSCALASGHPLDERALADLTAVGQLLLPRAEAATYRASAFRCFAQTVMPELAPTSLTDRMELVALLEARAATMESLGLALQGNLSRLGELGDPLAEVAFAVCAIRALSDDFLTLVGATNVIENALCNLAAKRGGSAPCLPAEVLMPRESPIDGLALRNAAATMERVWRQTPVVPVQQ